MAQCRNKFTVVPIITKSRLAFSLHFIVKKAPFSDLLHLSINGEKTRLPFRWS